MNLKIATNIIPSALLSLALIGVAIAQQQDQAPVAGKVTLGVAVAQTELIASGWRASKLIHADVYNDSNQKVGKIGDLIIAPDGSLSAAVVDVGGFLGMGTHRFAIPVQQFSQVTPKIVLPGATKDALKQMPEFKYS
jgi:sporulation protein YlmC with PRC-barrel domain